MRRGKRETTTLSFTLAVMARIEKERDIPPRSTWINEFLKMFFSDDYPTAIKLRRYVDVSKSSNLRETVRGLLDRALDEELQQRGLKGPRR